MFRGADAEADADRQVGVPAQAGHGLFDMLQGRRTGAGHAGHRDVVDEAGAAVEYLGQALVVGGRSGQADEVQARGLRRVAQVDVMFRRQVDHDQAVDPGFLGLGDKARDAVLVDRVEVAHQHQRRVLLVLAEFANHLQGLGQVLPAAQGADIRQLDRRAVGHRIGKGHAQFDHVGAGRRQALEDRQGGGVVGVAGGDEGHQGGAVLLLQLGKARLQAAHTTVSFCSCMWCMTVCISLSPRPDRLTTIRWSFGRVGARLNTSARAWALSRAGMMPSRRQQVWKAASASSSVTEVYSTRPISCNQACSGPMPG
ncbi:hypothetical protein D3C84_712620 [compost metagenome]